MPTLAPLKENEQNLVKVRLLDYYETSWSSVIVNIMKFKNPLVANAHALTTISAKVDQSSMNYFHIDWVKPGRHTFVIEHDIGNEVLDENQQYEERWQKFKEEKLRDGAKDNQTFYVHEMLSNFRADPLP